MAIVGAINLQNDTVQSVAPTGSHKRFSVTTATHDISDWSFPSSLLSSCVVASIQPLGGDVYVTYDGETDPAGGGNASFTLLSDGIYQFQGNANVNNIKISSAVGTVDTVIILERLEGS